MDRPRIGVDLDGTVYDFGTIAAYLLEKFRGLPPLQPPTRWNLRECWPMTDDDWKWLWTSGIDYHGLYRYGPLYVGAPHVLKCLAFIGDLVIITNRPNSARQDTLDWLSYMHVPSSEAHILGYGKPKSSVPCDLYIEDAPHNIRELLDNTAATIVVPRRDYNDHELFLPPIHANSWIGYRRIIRSKDWNQTQDEVLTWHKNRVTANSATQRTEPPLTD